MVSLCQPIKRMVQVHYLHNLKLQIPGSIAAVWHVAYSFLFCKQPMKGRVYKGLGWHLVYWLWPALNLVIAVWNVLLKTRSKRAFPINSQLILSLVSEGREADLVIEMDAILSYRSEDTEDYYMLLGCDELSSVRQWIMLFFFKFLLKVVMLNF